MVKVSTVIGLFWSRTYVIG